MELSIQEKTLKLLNVEKLLPVQEKALPLVFEGKNILVVAPTASGKTLVGEAAMIRALLQGRRAIYISPLRALTAEKFEDFKRFDFNNIGISTGDFTQQDFEIKYKDAVFTSVEKLDSLIRSDIEVLDRVGAIVFDEVHLLDEPDRGPTLEFLIALINKLLPKAQKIYLSATISNPKELAAWLRAELVISDYRPVKLHRKILYEGTLTNSTTEEIVDLQDPILTISNYLVQNRRQFIIFASTRKLANQYAIKISEIVNRWAKENYEELLKLREEILAAVDPPTRVCEDLANVVVKGVAFHHAGLVGKQRRLIEEYFKQGKLKAIVATPTLAMGVNLPANTVVISSIYRHSGFGSSPMKAFEIEQMVGRAGRPKYDKEGYAIYVARNLRDYEIIKERYYNPQLEPITSKFFTLSNLRIYTLALIAMNIANTDKELLSFFSSLLGEVDEIKFRKSLDFLIEKGFIENTNNRHSATRIGKLISQLYLDPYTGYIYINYLQHAEEDELSYLHALFCGNEISYPLSEKDYEIYESEAAQTKLAVDQSIVDYDKYIEALFLAHVMYDWINEASERDIEKNYGLEPGILYQLLETAKWLAYSITRIGRALGIKSAWLRKMEIRLAYGIKEELIPLIEIPGVGRARARKLYNNQIKSIRDIRLAGENKIKAILGEKIGKQIYEYCVNKKENEEDKTLI